ncbi:MAG: DUF4404 family protein [Planctomycetota bacterium]
MSELRDLLERVHLRLSQIEEPDDDARELLGIVMQDMWRVLVSSGDEPDDLLTNLETGILRLENDHPKLAVVVRRFLTTLGDSGI